MKYHFRNYKILLLIFDIFILFFSIMISYYLKFRNFPESQELNLVVFYIIICLFLFFIFDLYNPWSHFSKLPIYYKSLITFPIVVIIYLVFSFLFVNNNTIFESRTIFFFNAVLSMPLFFLARYYFYIFLQPEKLDIRLLVICNEDIIQNFQKEIEYRGGKWKVFYLVDENKNLHENQNFQIIGKIEKDFFDVLRQKWSAIVVAKKDLDKQKIQTLFEYKQKGMLVYDLIQFYEYYFFKIPLYYIDDYWFLSTKGFLIIENQTVVKIKRIIELIITIMISILILPFLPFLLILVYLSDGFPLIYKQERLGKDNQIFIAYKFRTMKKESDKLDPYTRENDPRVTRIGKILRKLRIDEIPQIINVLKGDLSLIGPRAEWIKLTEIYQKKVPFYYYRHIILPGLTGWAQVMYPYGASIEDTIQKLEYDLYYIKNYSLLLDFSIVIKTVRMILFARGR